MWMPFLILYKSVKKATHLIKMTFIHKRTNLDQLINLLPKAEEKITGSMIQISFGPKIRTSRQAISWSTIQCVFKIQEFAKINLPLKSAILVLSKAKSVDLKTYSPPS